MSVGTAVERFSEASGALAAEGQADGWAGVVRTVRLPGHEGRSAGAQRRKRWSRDRGGNAPHRADALVAKRSGWNRPEKGVVAVEGNVDVVSRDDDVRRVLDDPLDDARVPLAPGLALGGAPADDLPAGGGRGGKRLAARGDLLGRRSLRLRKLDRIDEDAPCGRTVAEIERSAGRAPFLDRLRPGREGEEKTEDYDRG